MERCQPQSPLLFQRRAEALLFHLLQGVEGGGEGARGLVPSRDGAVPGVSFVFTFERVENSLICKFIYIIKIQGRVSMAIVTTSHYEQRRGKESGELQGEISPMSHLPLIRLYQNVINRINIFD